MKIVINSTFFFHETTLPICINSLVESGCTDIEAVIGGSDSARCHIKDNVKYSFVPYDNFDLTSFIYLSELDGYPNFFYIHDTCKVGPKFYSSLVDKIKDLNICYKLTGDGLSMNIGYYTFGIVKQRKDDLIKLKNMDYSKQGKETAKLVALQHEDFILKPLSPAPLCSGRMLLEDSNLYNGVKRITEYYQDIDLYKYKANWNLSKHAMQVDL